MCAAEENIFSACVYTRYVNLLCELVSCLFFIHKDGHDVLFLHFASQSSDNLCMLIISII